MSTLQIAPTSQRERLLGGLFRGALFVSLAVGILTLVWLILSILIEGWPRLNQDVIFHFPSSKPEIAGAQSAIMGTIWVVGLTALITIPIGVGAAVYLEEYADRDRWWNRLIELNIQNLAAVPSIVYGILGLAFLVRGPLSLGNTMVAGGLTLGLLVLPVLIVAGREAIRAVPPSIREAALALGATKWQTIWKMVLPGSIAGIATGVILALSRAIGETAPLILVGAIAFRLSDPTIDGQFSALPIAIFQAAGEPRPEFQIIAAGAIVVLLAVLLLMNSVAIYLRNRYEQKW